MLSYVSNKAIACFLCFSSSFMACRFCILVSLLLVWLLGLLVLSVWLQVNPLPKQHLRITQTLGSFRGGSLPNVNHVANATVEVKVRAYSLPCLPAQNPLETYLVHLQHSCTHAVKLRHTIENLDKK